MPQTAFIWDLDGTLLDSYDAIMEALDETYKHYHLPFDADFIRHYILQESVGQLLDKMAKQQKLSPSELKAFFTEEQQKRDCKIKLLPLLRKSCSGEKKRASSNLSIPTRELLPMQCWQN